MDVRDSTSESLETFRNIENLEPPFEASSFVGGGRRVHLYSVSSKLGPLVGRRLDGSARLLCSVASRAVVVKEPAASNGLCPVSPQGLITPQAEGSARWSRGVGRGRLFLVRGTGSSRFNARQLGMARALAR